MRVAAGARQMCQVCATGRLIPLRASRGIRVAACSSCRSISTVDAIEAAYDDSYFKTAYIKYSAERSAFMDSILAILGDGTHRLLIDSGCGVGLAMDAGIRKGWDAVGCDSSLAAAQYCVANGLAVVQGHAEALPVRPESAHAVLILDVLAHLVSPRRAVEAAARALTPGGLLLIKTPRRPVWAYRIARLLPRVLAQGFVHLPYQIHSISARGLAAAACGAGLELMQVTAGAEAITFSHLLRGRPRAVFANLAIASFERLYGPPSTVLLARKPSAAPVRAADVRSVGQP